MVTRIFTKPTIAEEEIFQIKQLIAANPTWGRSKLSIELCHIWNWCDHTGKPKDISCRDMLRNLDSKGKIILPAAQRKARKSGSKDIIRPVLHETAELSCSIKDVLPVRIEIVKERTHQGHSMYDALLKAANKVPLFASQTQ